MKKIMFVFGTRPEAIKMAPLVHVFKNNRREFSTCVCVTAQHRQMLDDVLRIFSIKPDHDLNIMQDGQTLTHITGACIMRMEKILQQERPCLVLVHGDTTTTFASTIASFYQKIPVGHVEAGLRSYNKMHPYPEEANRLLTDSICDLYFAPTATARRALLRENVAPEKIFVTGNTVTDALAMALARKHSFSQPALREIFKSDGPVVLVTAHRRENFGAPFENIFRALRRIALRYPQVNLAYPVHLNPRVQEPAHRILGGIDNVHLLPPLDYLDLANLMKRSRIVVTDSGGLQEEAPSLGKPVLVLREVTERPEAVKAGTVKIVGTNEEKVFGAIEKLLIDKRLYKKMSQAVNPYGDGKAAARIMQAVRHYFHLRPTRPPEFLIR